MINMDKFLIVTNKNKDEGMEISKAIESFLSVRRKQYEMIGFNRKLPFIPTEMLENCDCVIVCGGDGTILAVADAIVESGKPILGVNMGHIGYLAGTSKEDIFDSLERLLQDDYKICKRMMISGDVYRNDSKILSGVALNDIVITRGGSLQVLNFSIGVSGKKLKSYSADGVIIATPTGSTAYNLSAGGPIAEPESDIILLTPISPHTLMNRTIVLKADDKVEIEILKAHDEDSQMQIEVNFDGGSRLPLQPGDIVTATRADVVTSLISFDEVSFLETLSIKMSEI